MPTHDNLESSDLERHLTEAHSRAEKGEYAAAVSAVRKAKSLAPKNVYVLAFEKQAEQLHELETSHSLTDEQRTDILESIPSIIERALESARSPGTMTDLSGLKAGLDATQEKKEKAAALEWLKNQYFQHAHEYIRKGEYQHALAEIRRVYIIDPSNAIARDFEKEFEALAQLKRGDSIRVYPTPGVSAPATPPVSPASPSTSGPAVEDPDTTPMMTEEWSSPQQPKRAVPRPPVVHEKPREKKKGSTLLIVLIILALVVLSALVYIYYARNIRKKNPVTVLPPAASEQFIGAPSEAAEQSFLVSNDDSTAGTPQVTELAIEKPPPPAAKSEATKETKKVSKKAATPDRARAGPAAAEGKPANSPPVMATQAQPGLKPPATDTKPEDTATPAPFVAIEKEARIIRLEKPKFTTLSYLTGVEGQVVIKVRIDATGKPVQTVTLKSTNDLLIQPVIDAVMSSQFAPAEMTTGPVASWLTIPFKFAAK
ncbi:MAG TPA: energy transducer TonB [Bacteroidota bacterium]|nr:energy transducer TonB [Bacteroidota bacterium]